MDRGRTQDLGFRDLVDPPGKATNKVSREREEIVGELQGQHGLLTLPLGGSQ